MPRVLNHVTVCRDGMHNAFPDLIHWQGAYWVTYRKSERHHYAPTARFMFATSTDRTRWREVSEVTMRGDVRGSKFAPLSDDRMGMVFSQVLMDPGKPDARQFQAHVAFTDDLVHWEEPIPILDPFFHIFRLRRREGRYYAMVTLMPGEERRLHLMASDDLIDWELVSRIGPDEDKINESDIHFRPDGEAWVVARTKRQGDHAWFGCAKPPYTDWELIDLKVKIHAPTILDHAGKLYVAGRCMPAEVGESAWPFGHSLCIWELERGKVTPVLRLPAAGDSSYCGLIEDPDGRVCIAYYSQHAYYLGVIPPFGGKVVSDDADPPRKLREGYAADIYFAEIDLS